MGHALLDELLVCVKMKKTGIGFRKIGR